MKRLLVLTLVVFMVLGLMGGVVAASETPNWFIEGEWSGWSWRTTNTFVLTIHEQDTLGNFTGTSVYGPGDERPVAGKVSGDKVEFTLDSGGYTSFMVGDITETIMIGTFQDTIVTTNKDEFAVHEWQATGEAINIAEGSYPAAPAVANELLKDSGIKARYGERNTGGNYIADVANHMDDNERFNGVSKYNKDAYRLEIAKFLIGRGADGVADLFKAELLTVVYEGEGDRFGSSIGDTLTFTFSNDIFVDENKQNYVRYTSQDFWFPDDGKSYIDVNGNVLTITIGPNDTYSSPRLMTGQSISGFEGVLDLLCNEVVVENVTIEVVSQ